MSPPPPPPRLVVVCNTPVPKMRGCGCSSTPYAIGRQCFITTQSPQQRYQWIVLWGGGLTSPPTPLTTLNINSPYFPSADYAVYCNHSPHTPSIDNNLLYTYCNSSSGSVVMVVISLLLIHLLTRTHVKQSQKDRICTLIRITLPCTPIKTGALLSCCCSVISSRRADMHC